LANSDPSNVNHAIIMLKNNIEYILRMRSRKSKRVEPTYLKK